MKHNQSAVLFLIMLLSPCFMLCGCTHINSSQPDSTAEIVQAEAPTAMPVDEPVEAQIEESITDAYLRTDPALDETVDTASTETELFYNPPTESPHNPIIKVYKSNRRLELFDGEILIGRFSIGLGAEPAGDKTSEGDGKTPVGVYYVCMRNPNSRYYRSLGVSYPSIKDAEHALSAGKIDHAAYEQIVNAINSKQRPPWDTPLGGEICIHGHGSLSDWTQGCIALNDSDMDILFEFCPLQTLILIYE